MRLALASQTLQQRDEMQLSFCMHSCCRLHVWHKLSDAHTCLSVVCVTWSSKALHASRGSLGKGDHASVASPLHSVSSRVPPALQAKPRSRDVFALP